MDPAASTSSQEEAKAATPPSAKRRPTAEDNEELIRVARVYPKYTLQQIIEIAEYPAGEQTARKRLKEAKVKLRKPPKKKAAAKKQWVCAEKDDYRDWVKQKKKENAKMRRQWAKEAEKTLQAQAAEKAKECTDK